MVVSLILQNQLQDFFPYHFLCQTPLIACELCYLLVVALHLQAVAGYGTRLAGVCQSRRGSRMPRPRVAEDDKLHSLEE